MTAASDIYEDAEPELARARLLTLAAGGDHEAEFYLGHLAEEGALTTLTIRIPDE